MNNQMLKAAGLVLGNQYAPSSQSDPAYDDEGRVMVSGSVETEWKQTALQSATKRARLYNEKLPWESSNLNGVFGSADLFTGTIASGYSHLFAPSREGIYDVLQSEMTSGISAASSSEAAIPVPLVRRIVLPGARRETSDEDIRRVTLAKLRDLVMGDPAATHLGISLQHLLSEGNMSHVIEQSFSDCFRAKASSTLQKRANSL